MTEREKIAALLAPAGIDLHGAFPDGDALVLVAGNGGGMWPRFLAWLAADPARVAAPHPLEAYVEEATRRAVAGITGEVRFAHDGPPFPPARPGGPPCSPTSVHCPPPPAGGASTTWPS